MTAPFHPGALVVVYVKDPREKIWGLLHELTPAGVSLRGIDLRSFDDWLTDRSRETSDGISASLAFYPLSRVEKILIDEESEGVPSLAEQVRARLGRDAKDLLAG